MRSEISSLKEQLRRKEGDLDNAVTTLRYPFYIVSFVSKNEIADTFFGRFLSRKSKWQPRFSRIFFFSYC